MSSDDRGCAAAARRRVVFAHLRTGCFLGLSTVRPAPPPSSAFAGQRPPLASGLVSPGRPAQARAGTEPRKEAANKPRGAEEGISTRILPACPEHRASVAEGCSELAALATWRLRSHVAVMAATAIPKAWKRLKGGASFSSHSLSFVLPISITVLLEPPSSSGSGSGKCGEISSFS